MAPLEHILIVVAALLLFGVLASRLSDKLGVPALLLFLLIGMLAGNEGIGGIAFDDTALTQTVGIIALSLILFSGGIQTEWSSVSTVLWKGLSLSTVGVLATALVSGSFAAVIFDFPWSEGLLLGAIMSSTDAAAVFAVLRSKGVRLKGANQPLLELESGSNDPMAVFLTVALIQVITEPQSSVLDLLVMLLLQMVVGAGVGYGIGKAAVLVINRVQLATEGLYPVLTLSFVLLTYGLASALRGNGFLAVYLAGIIMGSSDFLHKRSLIRFHDGLGWLMQIAMFVVLGLLVTPSHLVPVAERGFLIAAVLMFVARPVGVFLGLSLTRMELRQRLLISWVGLRGAVPIVLATYPFVAGIADSDLFFNIVFFVVLTSVLLQGTSIPIVARSLGLQEPAPLRREYPLEYVSRGTTRNDLVEIPLPKGSSVVGKQVVNLGMPHSALIVLISRNNDFLIPRGATALETGDKLLVLAEKEDIDTIRDLVGSATDQSSGVGRREELLP